ncbi:unnamed protein product [Prorocentrum cordatum]|uniref:Uncharacterized protein n=1 Tax=Prorocentrum cordatum TaxID=2364126 RepID=A0ABN9U8R1_9DINO|nr:unnamed protein product [Polarella glacialis]
MPSALARDVRPIHPAATLLKHPGLADQTLRLAVSGLTDGSTMDDGLEVGSPLAANEFEEFERAFFPVGGSVSVALDYDEVEEYERGFLPEVADDVGDVHGFAEVQLADALTRDLQFRFKELDNSVDAIPTWCGFSVTGPAVYAADVDSVFVYFNFDHAMGDITRFYEDFLGEAQEYVGSLLLEFRACVQLVVHYNEYDVDNGVRIFV